MRSRPTIRVLRAVTDIYENLRCESPWSAPWGPAIQAISSYCRFPECCGIGDTTAHGGDNVLPEAFAGVGCASECFTACCRLHGQTHFSGTLSQQSPAPEMTA